MSRTQKRRRLNGHSSAPANGQSGDMLDALRATQNWFAAAALRASHSCGGRQPYHCRSRNKAGPSGGCAASVNVRKAARLRSEASCHFAPTLHVSECQVHLSMQMEQGQPQFQSPQSIEFQHLLIAGVAGHILALVGCSDHALRPLLSTANSLSPSLLLGTLFATFEFMTPLARRLCASTRWGGVEEAAYQKMKCWRKLIVSFKTDSVFQQVHGDADEVTVFGHFHEALLQTSTVRERQLHQYHCRLGCGGG